MTDETTATNPAPTEPNEALRMQSMLAAVSSINGEVGAPEPAAEASENPRGGVAEPAEKQAPTSPEATDSQEKPSQPHPEGVLLKDGKTVVPYSVLENARHEASVTKQQLAASQAQLDEIQRRQNAGVPVDIADIPSDEILADYPDDVREGFSKARQVAANALTELQTVKAENQALREQREQEDLDRATASYTEEIDKWPLLKRLEEIGGPRYQQGIAISEALRKTPEHANLPLGQHLAEVDRQLREAIAEETRLLTAGAAPTPTPSPTTMHPAPVVPGKPLPTTVSSPSSLSDIQGGAPPALSEADGMISMHPADSVALMMKTKQRGGESAFQNLLNRTYR